MIVSECFLMMQRFVYFAMCSQYEDRVFLDLVQHKPMHALQKEVQIQQGLLPDTFEQYCSIALV